MTAVAYTTPTVKEQRNRKASEELRAYILGRILRVAKDWHVVNDANGTPEWPALASLDKLDNTMDATIVRDALIAAIIRGFREDRIQGPDIRVAYARILAMLVDYIWVAKHPYEPSQWPLRVNIGEW
jgi:hypothetical protein